VITQIESVFEHQVDVLLAKRGSCAVSLKSRPKMTATIGQSTTPTSQDRIYRYPGNSAEEAWRFSLREILEVGFQ
jgi:hypothetical protein